LQDDECGRLARDLHDSTGQMLAALKINLEIINAGTDEANVTIKPLVSESVAITEEMTRQLRTLSYLLHPPLLDESGLQFALHWYADGFAQRSGIDVKLPIGADFSRLLPDLEIATFRVVQESLTNIHRHSHSSTALIRVQSDSECVQIEIIDSGRWASENAPEVRQFVPGVGIMGMRERMRQLGGNFEIIPSPDGTTNRATIPLKDAVLKAV
jgi:signal transduction histidine kinase